MKRIIRLTILFIVCSASCSLANQFKFFVGTYTSQGAEGIYLCSFNSDNGKISLLNTFHATDPSFLKVSPDKKYLFTAERVPVSVEKTGGFVKAYRITENDSIIFINKQISNGRDPCHLDVSPDGRFVAVAAYNSGTTSLYPVNDEGVLSPATSVIQNTGSSVVENRQSAPHAHSIKFSPFNNLVFSADLGTDQLNIFSIDEDKLVSYDQEYVKMVPGAGPRHFDFHPDGKVIYVINELNSTVTALKDSLGIWKKFQDISTLPAGFEGTNYCADVHVSDNGKFLYGSNRGHNSIAVFEINASKKLNFITTVATVGEWPRNFTISPDGDYLLVANQNSGNITVFEIDKKSGIPEFTGQEIKLSAPVCLEFY